MNNPKKRVTSVHARNVPVDVRDLFKAYCAARGYTMEAAVRELLLFAVERDLALPRAAARKQT